MVGNWFSTVQITAVCSKTTNKITYFGISSDCLSLIIIFNYYRIIHILLLNMLDTSLLRILPLNLFINGWEIIVIAFPRRQNAHIIYILSYSGHIKIIRIIHHLLICLQIPLVLRIVSWFSSQTLETIVYIRPGLKVLFRFPDNHTLIASFLCCFVFLTSFRITSAVFFRFVVIYIQLQHLLNLRTSGVLLINN